MQKIELNRYEFKYLLTPGETQDVRQYLSRYCRADCNAAGHEWYGIRSLYLDNDQYALYNISATREQERLKLRVRGYTTGNGPVKLEVKRRIGDVVNKISQPAPGDTWPAHIRTGQFGRLVEELRARPKVLVEYERHALFSTVDDYVRVTFDRHIRVQRVRDWSIVPDPRQWQSIDDPVTQLEEDSLYVMELKFIDRPPAWLRDMVLRFNLTRRGFSKYVRGVKRLERWRSAAWDMRNGSSRAWRVA